MGKQVALSIEQMKHLEELGLDISDASMYWGFTYPKRLLIVPEDIKSEDLDWENVKDNGGYPTYTLQDILEKFPIMIACKGIDNYYHLQITKLYKRGKYGFMYWHRGFHTLEKLIAFTNIDILEAAYQMLCWCIENNYIETK